MSDPPQMSDAARRGIKRAGVHLVRAAIEVVNGISALLEELQAARTQPPDDEAPPRRHIPVEE